MRFAWMPMSSLADDNRRLQEEAVKMVVDGVRSEAFNPNTLFLIGTYKIGKERCFLEASPAKCIISYHDAPHRSSVT
jgi:hypothetical protein